MGAAAMKLRHGCERGVGDLCSRRICSCEQCRRCEHFRLSEHMQQTAHFTQRLCAAACSNGQCEHTFKYSPSSCIVTKPSPVHLGRSSATRAEIRQLQPDDGNHRSPVEPVLRHSINPMVIFYVFTSQVRAAKDDTLLAETVHDSRSWTSLSPSSHLTATLFSQ